MRIIRAPNLAKAHELVVKTVLEHGSPITTEDGESTIEAEEVAIRVEDPLTEPMVSRASRFQKRFMEEYARALIEGSAAMFEYDYHSRLFDWGERLDSRGSPVHLDQVDYIIRKLKMAQQTRRALAITWNPVVDEDLDECPCLQLVQCLVRKDTLHMKVVFRSNDMLTAAGANMFALVSLQRHISDAIGLRCGSYTHISLVPHIYIKRDAHDIPPFCMTGAGITPVKEACQICQGCRSRSYKAQTL
jgi:thymidylate synthase